MRCKILIALAALSVSASGLAAQTFEARAGKIVDGDTLYFKDRDGKYRLWGIDTPESDDAGYRAAAEALGRLVGAKSLRCEIRDIDDYGRHVAHCRVGAQDIGAAMVAAGWACDFKRYSKGAYAVHQVAARTARLGIWQRDDIPKTWRFRCF